MNRIKHGVLVSEHECLYLNSSYLLLFLLLLLVHRDLLDFRNQLKQLQLQLQHQTNVVRNNWPTCVVRSYVVGSYVVGSYVVFGRQWTPLQQRRRVQVRLLPCHVATFGNIVMTLSWRHHFWVCGDITWSSPLIGHFPSWHLCRGSPAPLHRLLPVSRENCLPHGSGSTPWHVHLSKGRSLSEPPQMEQRGEEEARREAASSSLSSSFPPPPLQSLRHFLLWPRLLVIWLLLLRQFWGDVIKRALLSACGLRGKPLTRCFYDNDRWERSPGDIQLEGGVRGGDEGGGGGRGCIGWSQRGLRRGCGVHRCVVDVGRKFSLWSGGIKRKEVGERQEKGRRKEIKNNK